MQTTILKIKFWWAFLFVLIAAAGAMAQNAESTPKADTLYRVETNDGNVFIGEIISMDKEKVVLQSEALGTITLHQKFIVKIEQVVGAEVAEGDVWYRNLQSARYFFAPNGYGLKKGESYYQNIWVFYNQYSVGITDRFSIGVGMVPLFFFNFAPTPIWITPKFSIPLAEDRINLGVGALVGYVIGVEGAPFGITFASVTFGPHDKNVSIGLGYAFAGGNFASAPVINIGGLLRVSRKSYLMTENYFVAVDGVVGGFMIFGARSMINRTAIDYGLGFPVAPGMDGFLAMPWLGLTVPFQKK